MTMDIGWMPIKCIDLLKLSMFEKTCYASVIFSIETQKEAGCLHARNAIPTLARAGPDGAMSSAVALILSRVKSHRRSF